MKRRQLLKGLAGLTLTERLLSLRAAWAAGQRAVPPGVHEVAGDVRINGQPARPGMPVQPGDRIVTGPDGRVIYVVGQDAYLQREQSSVQLLGERITTGLRVASGKLLSVFGKGSKQLETPTATIGIRGTGCYIEASPERVYFCLCYGVAEVVPLADPSHAELVETSHHDKPMYILANAQKMVVPSTVQNHTDDELILLEALVARVPPFVGKGGYPY